MLQLVKIFVLIYNGAMYLEEKIARQLTAQNKTIALAESCSGGLLSHRLTNIPGSSRFFKICIVAYSNDIKIKLLKVPLSLIKKHGAVSEEVALTMARHVRKIFHTDFGLSITGIAGPSGGTVGKPVGLTFIALSTRSESISLKCQFKGRRKSIKTQATSQALLLLQEFL